MQYRIQRQLVKTLKTGILPADVWSSHYAGDDWEWTDVPDQMQIGSLLGSCLLIGQRAYVQNLPEGLKSLQMPSKNCKTQTDNFSTSLLYKLNNRKIRGISTC